MLAAPRLLALLAVAVMAAAPAAGQARRPPAPGATPAPHPTAADTAAAPEVSPYVIFRTHLPPGLSGPQAAVPHGRYIVNFGSRDGVMRGSIFRVHERETYVGLVRVEQVWRDSAAVRLVQLDRKLNLDTPLPLERGYRLYPRYVLLESINFGSGKPELSAAMHERLRYAARFILSFADYPLVIEGHTDNRGKKADNLKLSQERAEAIRTYLHEVQRIPLSRMRPIGYADERPIASNDTPEGRQRNRRVDIVMLDAMSSALAAPDSAK
ncbi:MAG: OmpA family protein [Gemmatimonadota bacterium]